MTGRISRLDTGNRTGIIKMPDGSRRLFAAAQVLGDFDTLAVGHTVTFEVEQDGEQCLVASVRRQPARAPAVETNVAPDLRYVGFEQSANRRVYCFDAVSLERSVQHWIAVEMELLRMHHVGIQEVPALCRNKLAADLRIVPDSVFHHLANADLSACPGRVRRFGRTRNARLGAGS